jgi:choline transport protein
MLVTFIVMLLNLINLGSTTAFFAILSLNTLALYISYIIPILFFIMAKLRHDPIPYGPFRLGRFGLPINIFALVYAIFIAIFLPFPPFVPVNSTTMNYGGPVMGFVIIFAILDWFVNGRKRFQVPVDPIESMEMDESRR